MSPNSADILQRIIQQKQVSLAQQKRQIPLEILREKLAQAPQLRGFQRAISAQVADGQAAVIAEIKKASPSKGVIRSVFDPADIAQSYEKAGATCLSVLTETDFFQGSIEDLQAARATCSLPVLRKDFIIDPYQIYESRVIGADCILLIAAILSDEQLAEFSQLAQELKLDVLMEAHSEAELIRVLKLKSPLLGINNRDLHTFKTDLQTTVNLSEQIPEGVIRVSESGIEKPSDIIFLQSHHVHAFLIGETFMRAEDPGAKLSELLSQAKKS